MKSLLKELQDEQSILLMYISGELSAHDNNEVEQMLAASPEMQQRLEQLRGTIAGVETFFAESDKHLPNVERATARAITGIRQLHAAARIGTSIPAQPSRRLPLPWWMYPLAAAASILVAAAVFMANTDPDQISAAQLGRFPPIMPQDIYVMSSPVLDRQGVPALEDYDAAAELVASFESPVRDLDVAWVSMQRDISELQSAAAMPWGDVEVYW